MKFDGQAIQCILLDGGIAELRFDLKADSVNKFNQTTLDELARVIALLQAEPGLRGLLVSSAKDCFVVGADVTEFQGHFQLSEQALVASLLNVHRLFAIIEDFDFPTVTALNGFAFGGGLEFALTTSYRVMAADTRIGVPESKLGIFPGWGGTVRLSRLAGADNAIEWIASGEQYGAEAALKVGLVDAVVAPGQVRAAALDLLGQAMAGRRDWKARRLEKVSKLQLNPTEAMMVFESAKALVGAKAGPNYPAPLTAIEVMRQGAGLGRDQAMAIEAAAFARIAKGPTAFALVSLFLAERQISKQAKALAGTVAPVGTAAVLGAGIMGGGIAYQSAAKGTRIVLKDIQEKALALGMAEVTKLLLKRVERGKLSPAGMADVFTRIQPTLSYGDFLGIDLAVEAVIENEQVKRGVLQELEAQVRPETILTSNTSTISITRLAQGLARPEQFCGLHFFNPVHKMPLVEVIRGARSSDRAVATAVSYALAMGKTPIVVQDCPGFLVNRILFPYFAGFTLLVGEGVPFQRIDQVMEKFGWPMGPAYLLDVVGLDTAHHANQVMGQGFPDRMAGTGDTAISTLFAHQRRGQKNGRGFYAYKPDKQGRPQKQADPTVQELLAPLVHQDRNPAISDQDILDRMLLPMIIECSRCLEDGIVRSPAEVDLGLVYGLGFPPFRGGALRYADSQGLQALCARADQYHALGKLYQPTDRMRQLAATGQAFFEAR